MDLFDVAYLLVVVSCLGGILWIGIMTFLHMRRRRERLQMKRHVQTLEVVNRNEFVRRT
jgi:hypothetical protein